MSALLRFLLGTIALGLIGGGSAQAADEPAQLAGELSLVRYDLPRGLSDGFAPTRQLAQRREGPEGVDWPDFTLNGQPIFRQGPVETRSFPLRRSSEARSPFQLPTDEVLQPGGHWFRPMEWVLGRRHLYTADRTARTANATAALTGRYELWLFPIRIEGRQGAPMVKNVTLRYANREVYRRAGPWRVLTLLVPANEPGVPYELSIDGRGTVIFEAGLQRVQLGNPRELVIPVEATLDDRGGRVQITHLASPEVFPHPQEWAEDLAAQQKPWPATLPLERGNTALARHLGVEVPRSPLTIYGTALPHGMSGGFYGQGGRGFKGSPEEYAAHLAGMGFDAVFDQVNALPAPQDAQSVEQRAAALARHGIKFGLQYDNSWTRPSLQHPNLALFAHTLPEWHAPLYRSLQLATQRFRHWPNFLGLTIGADNAGYVSSWHWAPPIPDRPWGEAMIELLGTPHPEIPRAPSLGSREFGFERPVQTQAEFLSHVTRYETSFRQYGYFAEAVREIEPQLVFTTGSFGSAPGASARGGWPFGSPPARLMFESCTTLQAYDWNQLHGSKPLHNVALVDRLNSYLPAKRTWALIDNFQFLFGRESMQRAVALALTRGVQGIGTNFLAHATGDSARPEVVAFQTELHAWAHRYGGVYARTQPHPSIAIFFSHHQAVQRPVLRGENLKPEELYAGSHEGKVNEALFLCHAAGWPARVITFQEMMRAPLPSSIQAILLVGLPRFDDSWIWSPGLETKFQEFVARGGRVLVDDESVAPVAEVKSTGLRVAAYVPQADVDPTPKLFARNAENIEKLRAAMQGAPLPIAVSESPRLWAVPTEAGNTLFVTAISQAFAEGDEARVMVLPANPRATKPELWKTKGNASRYVPPQSGTLQWRTERPIYDVRLQKKLTPAEAAAVDLTQDAFRWYALPAAEVTAPEAVVAPDVAGFYEAKVTMRNGQALTGLPVEIRVQRGDEAVSVYGASGDTVRLPIHRATDRGVFSITVKELLTGLATTQTLNSDSPAVSGAAPSAVAVREPSVLAKFAARKNVPLAIGLTPMQEKNSAFLAQAKALAQFYESRGRKVTMRSVSPGGLVKSLQPHKSPNRYPQWSTTPTDLVLFGTPADNVLLFDQARGQLFPRDLSIPTAGAAEVHYTRSPFVGEYDAVNVLARDPAGVAAAVAALRALK